MNRFENKVVVITGAAGGIGEATTRRIQFLMRFLLPAVLAKQRHAVLSPREAK